MGRASAELDRLREGLALALSNKEFNEYEKDEMLRTLFQIACRQDLVNALQSVGIETWELNNG